MIKMHNIYPWAPFECHQCLVDEEEAKFIAKRKMLGNIKFIGELGKLEILHDSILHRCCEQVNFFRVYSWTISAMAAF